MINNLFTRAQNQSISFFNSITLYNFVFLSYNSDYLTISYLCLLPGCGEAVYSSTTGGDGISCPGSSIPTQCVQYCDSDSYLITDSFNKPTYVTTLHVYAQAQVMVELMYAVPGFGKSDGPVKWRNIPLEVGMQCFLSLLCR